MSSQVFERGRVQARARSSAFELPRWARVSSHTKELGRARWARSSSGAYELTSTGAFEPIRARARIARARARARPSHHTRRARTSSNAYCAGACKLRRVQARLFELTSTDECKPARVKDRTCTMGSFELGRVRSHVNGRFSSCALERGCVRARAHSSYSGAYDLEQSSSCPRARVRSHVKERRLVRWARSSSGAHELTSAGEFELVRARARACPSYHAHWAHDCLSSRSRARVSLHGAFELGRMQAHVNGRAQARAHSSGAY